MKRSARALESLHGRYLERLYGLMEEIGIEVESPQRWQLLATELAEQLGRLRDEWDEISQAWLPAKQGERKAGRKKEWSASRKRHLVNAVDAIIAEKTKRKPSEAANLLKKRDKEEAWKTYSAATIAARYSDFKTQKLPAHDAQHLKTRILARQIAEEVRRGKIKRTFG